MVRAMLLLAGLLQAPRLADAVQHQRRAGRAHRHGERVDEAEAEAQEGEERWRSPLIGDGLQKVSNALNWQRRLEGYLNPGSLDTSAVGSKYDDSLGIRVYEQQKKNQEYKGAGRISDEQFGRMLKEEGAKDADERSDKDGHVDADARDKGADADADADTVRGDANRDAHKDADKDSSEDSAGGEVPSLEDDGDVSGAPAMATNGAIVDLVAAAPAGAEDLETVSDLYEAAGAGTVADGTVADATTLGSRSLEQDDAEAAPRQRAVAVQPVASAADEVPTVSDLHGASAAASCEGCKTVCQWLRMSEASDAGCPIFDLSLIAQGASGSPAPEADDVRCVTDVLHKAVPRTELDTEVRALERCIASLPSGAAEKYRLSLDVVSGEIGDWRARRSVARESEATQRRLAETLSVARRALEAKAAAEQPSESSPESQQ